MNHLCSIDFEIAGLYDDAVVLTMGMTITEYDQKDVTFDELVQTGLYLRFDYAEQLKLGRKTQASVMDWWKKQTPEARDAAWSAGGRISIKELPDRMKAFFSEKGIDPKKVDWYDRNMFDTTKLQHIFEETLSEKVFWNYQSRFEFSTALRFLGHDRYGGLPASKFPGAIHHHSLHDAAMDHLRLLNAIHN